MATTNKRARVSTLLGNTRVLALIAFLLALVIWLAVSINESPVVERVVRDVKIEVDGSMPSQLGYEAFGADNLYVDVTVSGKRYEVGDNVLTPDDLTVTAVTTSVDSPGKYTLQLRAASKDPNPDYKIISKSKDTIDVYFDAPKTIDVPVEPVVRSSGNLVDSSKFLTQDPIPSQTSVAVRGPATYVEKISHAYAYADTSGNLRNSETFDATLKIVDENDDTVKYLSTDAAENITVTVPVYQITTLPVTVSFSSTPSAYIDNPPKVRISPSTIHVAVDPDKLEGMKRISIGTIDFSEIESGTTDIFRDTFVSHKMFEDLIRHSLLLHHLDSLPHRIDHLFLCKYPENVDFIGIAYKLRKKHRLIIQSFIYRQLIMVLNRSENHLLLFSRQVFEKAVFPKDFTAQNRMVHASSVIICAIPGHLLEAAYIVKDST